MVKSELIKAIAESVTVPEKDVEIVVNTLISKVQEGLKNDGELTLRGLGTFKVSQKQERPGRNPKTGENAIITARKVITFKASVNLKNYLNQK